MGRVICVAGVADWVGAWGVVDWSVNLRLGVGCLMRLLKLL